MPYIGNTIRAADDYRLIDDISSSFNGSTTSFALQVAGSSPVPFPKSPQQILISVNGVIQEPDPTGSSGFNLVGTNIVFSSAPAGGNAFFGIIYATADYLNAGGTFPAGSTGAPSVTFIGDENTGLYRKGGGSIGFVADATEIANTDSNGITISSGNLIIPDKIIHNGDTNTAIRFPAADTFSVETGGSEKLRVDSSGRLLVGTTTEGNISADDLTVAGSGDTGITVRSGTSNSGNLFFSDGTSGGDEYRGYLQYQHSTNKLAIGTNATTAITIDSSGNVGIGTSTPTDYNNLAENLVVATSSDTGITVATGTSSQGSLFFADGTSGSAMVEGFVAYEHSNNALKLGTSNAERMRIDSSGFLGIGMTPGSGTGYVLQLDSGAAQTFMSFGNTGSGNGPSNGLVVGNDTSRAYFTQRENQPIHIATNNVDRIVIDASGHFLPNADSTYNIGSSGVRFANGYFDTLYGDGSNLTGISSSSDSISEGNSTFEVLDTGANGIARFLPEGSEVFRITHQGFVGINTTNPERQLHIVGSDGATSATLGNSDTQLILDNLGTNGAIMEFLSANNGGGRIHFTDTDAAGQGAIDYTHSNNYMTIKSAANIYLKPAGGENGITVGANGTVSLYYDNGLKFQTNHNRTFHYVSCNPANSGNMDLGSTSERWRTVYATNAFNTSDKTLKQDILTCDLGLDFVNKLKPVSYKWIQKDLENLDTKTHYGLIAQDVEEALTESGKTLDSFGGVSKEDTGAMGLAYTEIISPLVKAVQELSAEVETLKTKVAALETA